MPETPDLKPRSRDVTDGLERAAARGMLRAVGMGDDDWEKPQIGVASSWNEITPCNLSLDRLAKAVSEAADGRGDDKEGSEGRRADDEGGVRCHRRVVAHPQARRPV